MKMFFRVRMKRKRREGAMVTPFVYTRQTNNSQKITTTDNNDEDESPFYSPCLKRRKTGWSERDETHREEVLQVLKEMARTEQLKKYELL